MSDSLPVPARKRGGQPGNLNAATHGFYSHQFKPADLEVLDQAQTTNLDQEIELLRLSIRHLIDMAGELQTAADAADQLRIICLAMQTLNNLIRTQQFLIIHRGDFI